MNDPGYIYIFIYMYTYIVYMYGCGTYHAGFVKAKQKDGGQTSWPCSDRQYVIGDKR